jgi:hypothetical protein
VISVYLALYRAGRSRAKRGRRRSSGGEGRKVARAGLKVLLGQTSHSCS